MAKSNALKFGFLGALTGLMDAKIGEWKTRLAEEAEMRKQERLEQLKIAAEVRAEERTIAAEGRAQDRWFEQQDTLAAIAKDADDRRAQQAMDLEGSKHAWRVDEARVGAGYRMAEQDDEQAAQRERDQWLRDNPTPSSASANDGMYYVNDAGDRVWVTPGKVAPAGYRPESGFGVTFAPSASKSGGAPGVSRPGQQMKRPDTSGMKIVVGQ